MTAEIVTFGCRLNAWESEAMRRLTAEAGLSDALVFNTCAVTAEAERQARQAIRRARRERPGVQIVVTGCAAQIAPERWLAMEEVDRVVGNAEKLTAGAWKPDAPPALWRRRGSRGRLALTRVACDGFEREERLRVTAVFEDAEVLRPAEAALELLRQPCTDVPPFRAPLAVTPEHLDEVVNEELFFEHGAVADAEQTNFESNMAQLDQYLADRALVLRRNRDAQLKRLANAERRRAAASGAERRNRAEADIRAIEATLRRIERESDALAARDHPVYRRWRAHAHDRRYHAPAMERLLSVEFVIALGKV